MMGREKMRINQKKTCNKGQQSPEKDQKIAQIKEKNNKKNNSVSHGKLIDCHGRVSMIPLEGGGGGMSKKKKSEINEYLTG